MGKCFFTISTNCLVKGRFGLSAAGSRIRMVIRQVYGLIHSKTMNSMSCPSCVGCPSCTYWHSVRIKNFSHFAGVVQKLPGVVCVCHVLFCPLRKHHRKRMSKTDCPTGFQTPFFGFKRPSISKMMSLGSSGARAQNWLSTSTKRSEPQAATQI